MAVTQRSLFGALGGIPPTMMSALRADAVLLPDANSFRFCARWHAHFTGIPYVTGACEAFYHLVPVGDKGHLLRLFRQVPIKAVFYGVSRCHEVSQKKCKTS
jgi:hypothetical protein